MKKVILYARVSTDEQAQQGFSLEYQMEQLERYSLMKNYIIVNRYVEDFSAKTFNRPEWNKIISLIKSNPNSVDKIIFLRYDRFSRHLQNSLSEIQKLKKWGVEIEMMESNIDMDTPEAILTQAIMLAIPQVENEKNSKRTKEGTWKARMKGCFTGVAPYGYKNTRIDKNASLEINNDAPIIKSAFEKMASGNYSADEVRRWVNQQGIYLSKNTFFNIIRNVAYKGEIFVNPFLDNPRTIVKGLHPPIVSEELWATANDVLKGRRRKMKFKNDKSDLYPLNGQMICKKHNLSLTGYGPKGRSRHYHYYICTTKEGKCQRFTTDYAMSEVERILSQIQVSAQAIKSYHQVLEQLFSSEDLERRKQLSKTVEELKNLNMKKEFLQGQYLDGLLPINEYKELKEVIDLRLFKTDQLYKNLLDTPAPFKEFLKKEVPMLEDLVGFFRTVDGETKKKVMNCIFDEKIYFDETKTANGKFNPTFELIVNASKVLEGSKNKKEVLKDLLCTLAPQSGLEPETL